MPLRRLRAAWRLGRVVVHALHGLAIVHRRFAQLDREARREHIRWWAAKMLRVLGVRLAVHGSLQPGAKLLVANHVSWLDIVAVHAMCPQARFVAKADLQAWPLVARLVGAAETIYIERERRRDALRVVHQIAAALQEGDTVAVFPEGTTGDGAAVLPFHANLLQAAIATATPVQAVALRFSDRDDAISRAAPYVGETTLAQSLWRLACAQGMVAHVAVQAARGTAHADRRRLAASLREEIETTLARLTDEL